MRILEHRIFSKSFGGKIFRIWTDVTYRTNFFKKGARVLWAPYFFFSFLAGKFKTFKQPFFTVRHQSESTVSDFGKISGSSLLSEMR